MGEKIIQDFVRSITEYNSKIKSNSQLRDDYQLLAAYYSSNKAGNEITIAGVKIKIDEIMRIARLIFDEIENRKTGQTMEHEWNVSKMRPAAKELFDSFSIIEPEREHLLSDHINEDIVIIENAVCLSDPKSTEVRLSLDEGPLSRIIKSKLYKMFPDDVAQKLNITHPTANLQNPVPLFDLVLKRREAHPNGVQLMAALTPASPHKIFYNIPDLVEACFI